MAKKDFVTNYLAALLVPGGDDQAPWITFVKHRADVATKAGDGFGWRVVVVVLLGWARLRYWIRARGTG